MTLSGADKTAVDALLDKSGSASSTDTTTTSRRPKIGPPARLTAVAVADTAGNAINVTVYTHSQIIGCCRQITFKLILIRKG